MNEGPALISVVDDDPSVRKSLSRLLRSVGYQVSTHATPAEFLESSEGPRCAVLDVELPGLSGMELQQRLKARREPVPIVFITGHGDIPMGVEAMKEGAVDFLPKPFEDHELLDAVERAIEKDRAWRREREELQSARQSLIELTPREHEVMRYVIAGMLNKQIALELDIAEKTVKVHRGRVMEKSGVDSLAELVRLCERAEIRPVGPRSHSHRTPDR